MLADFLNTYCTVIFISKKSVRKGIGHLFFLDTISGMVCVCLTSATCHATNHCTQQPAVVAGSFIRGLFGTLRASGHLLWVCVPFKEICDPILKSVCPHQLNENGLVSCLLLGCFYCSDRRRQLLKELLRLHLTSCQTYLLA